MMEQSTQDEKLCRNIGRSIVIDLIECENEEETDDEP